MFFYEIMKHLGRTSQNDPAAPNELQWFTSLSLEAIVGSIFTGRAISLILCQTMLTRWLALRKGIVSHSWEFLERWSHAKRSGRFHINKILFFRLKHMQKCLTPFIQAKFIESTSLFYQSLVLMSSKNKNNNKKQQQPQK